MAIKRYGYTVILDACVLYPAPLRDFLIELAAGGLFRAKWTEQIHTEWIENLLSKRPDLERSKLELERTKSLMNSSVQDCLVTGYEDLVESIKLPDANDRHVLAAAIVSECDSIITYNLKDFPTVYLMKYNIEPQHPDEFIYNQFDLHNPGVLISAQRCRLRLNPPKNCRGVFRAFGSARLNQDG